MLIIVIITKKIFVLKPKLEDANTLGIIKKITKGFIIPPVKYINELNWNISIIKNINADLSESWVLLYTNIKYKLLITPKKIIKFDTKKLKLKLK